MTSARTRAELSEKMLGIKREKGWSWKYICGEIGGMSPVLITGAVLGQMKLTKPQVGKAAELFGLDKSEQALLNEVPNRGSPMPPTDPLIYRFYELVMVNGPALKVLIEEEFGDGIMSAIDFDLTLERQPDPKGDRVKLTMSGKFLPYKYYGSNRQRAGVRVQGRIKPSSIVMAGLVPAIHDFAPTGDLKTWMPATSAGMTNRKFPCRCYAAFRSRKGPK